jgi:hypothetical protein
MKVALVATALALAPSALGEATAIFFGRATHSASRVQYLPLEARDGSIWVGGANSTTFCPDDVKHCPSERDAVFAASQGGVLEMWVEVPGGQQAYIDKHGWLRYTKGHTGFIPPGSSWKGFKHIPPSSTNEAFGYLKYKGRDWWACPVGGDPYNLRVNIERVGKKCIGFRWIAPPTDKYGAWLYTS